jgi:hypothetical protein
MRRETKNGWRQLSSRAVVESLGKIFVTLVLTGLIVNVRQSVKFRPSYHVLAIILVALVGCGTWQKKIQPTAQWMLPLRSQWILQSPGKSYSIQSVSTV